MTEARPLSPVQRALKFSAVIGTTSLYNSTTILPSSSPAMLISKKQRGFTISERDLARGNGRFENEIEMRNGMEHGLGVGVTVLHIHIHIHIETAMRMNMLRAAINA